MAVEPGEPWGTHNAHIERHPAVEGTVLARGGCAGTLRIDSVMSRDRVVVRCDGCWKLFAIGPAHAAAKRKDEAIF
jgi:hypothetical protein